MSGPQERRGPGAARRVSTFESAEVGGNAGVSVFRGGVEIGDATNAVGDPEAV
jgi:hypothetical protein